MGAACRAGGAFTGRAEELAGWTGGPPTPKSPDRRDRVGGAGKTALVTQWVQAGGVARRPGLRGVFAMELLADPSAEHWARAVLDWARRTLESR